MAENRFRVTTCEDPDLRDQRSVLLADLVVEVFFPVVGVTNEHLSVQHGGVAQLSAAPPAQQAPGQLALVHHRCHHKTRLLQGLPPELKALELGHWTLDFTTQETRIH